MAGFEGKLAMSIIFYGFEISLVNKTGLRNI